MPPEILAAADQFVATAEVAKQNTGVRDTGISTCQHPGCNVELQLNTFVVGDREFVRPGCAFCDEHVVLYQYGRDKVADDRLVRHKAAWGKYSMFDQALLPPRRIEHFPIHSTIGHEISDKDMIALIYESGRGCLFQGDTGLGKTYTLFALSEYFVRMTGRVPTVCYAPMLRLELSEAATSEASRDKGVLINKLTSAGRLFIDDIGSANFTESFEESIKMVIEERGKSIPMLPIFTSLQQTSKEFIHGPRGDTKRRAAIIRRLCEDCLIFKFTAK